MNKFKLLKVVLLLLLFPKTILSANKILIIADVENNIITNYDLQKEIKYLQIFNPNLKKLKIDQLKIISKNSLINEIIKEQEIKKLINIEIESINVDNYMQNLYLRIGLNNENEFKKKIKNENELNFNEIKKKIQIEVLWNDLIYNKFKSLVNIDEQEILQKIDGLKNTNKKEFLLSEIVFSKKKDVNFTNLINSINESIKEIGFNNTANLYSISDSSKFGGKIGWIDKNNLPNRINKELEKLDIGKHSNVLNIDNNYLILKIEDVRISKIKIDKEDMFKKIFEDERNKQLSRYSKIFFDKIKINYTINEY